MNSDFEEEWLVESLNKLDLTDNEERETIQFIYLLLDIQEISLAKSLYYQIEKFIRILIHKNMYKTNAQKEFEEMNPQVYDLY